jgi:hypothetical protein
MRFELFCEPGEESFCDDEDTSCGELGQAEAESWRSAGVCRFVQSPSGAGFPERDALQVGVPAGMLLSPEVDQDQEVSSKAFCPVDAQRIC